MAVALLFGSAFGWLAWRLLQQDRVLARQRRLEQLVAAADRVSAAMYRRLGELEEALADPQHGTVAPGAVLVRPRRDGVVVRPPDGLVYLPVMPTGVEQPLSTFADGEALEFQKNDPVAAAAAFRRLTHLTAPTIRAGALVRLGRNLAKCGRVPEALRVFDELASMGAIPVGGLPAELVALEAKCSLLERLGRRSDLQREARHLHDNLTESRWPLSRASYEFRIEEAQGWLGEAPDSDQLMWKVALSAAAQVLWADWLRDPAGKGRRSLMPDGIPVLAAWIASQNELTALLAPTEAIGCALSESGDFQARLIDAEGQTVLGSHEPLGATLVSPPPTAAAFIYRSGPSSRKSTQMGRRSAAPCGTCSTSQ